jgi:hypothetical protein
MKLTHSHLFSAEDDSGWICTSATIRLQGYFNLTISFKTFAAPSIVGYAAVGRQVKKATQDRPYLLYLKFSEKNERSI